MSADKGSVSLCCS